MKVQRSRHRGFTLVEILIVVIILGILAAIVIPQFTNASTDARLNSTISQLQTLRSQIQLFGLQHNGTYPDLVGVGWTEFTSTTDVTGAVNATGTLGPYLQTVPANPLNSNTTVGTAAATGIGWIYANTAAAVTGMQAGQILATNQTPTKILDETGATVPQVQ